MKNFGTRFTRDAPGMGKGIILAVAVLISLLSAGLFAISWAATLPDSASADFPEAASPPGVPATHADLEMSVGPCARENDDGTTWRPPDGGATDHASFPPVTADFQRRVLRFYLPSSTNGRALLLTGGDDAQPARIWDAETGGAIAKLENSRGFWRGDRLGPRIANFGPVATFSGNGSRVLLVSDSGETAVWDTASGHLVATLRVPGMAIAEALLNDDGTRAALAGLVGTDHRDRYDLVSWSVASGGQYRPVASDVAAMMSDDTGTRFLLEEWSSPGRFHVWSTSIDGPEPSITISNAIPSRTSLMFRGDRPLVALLREEGQKTATVDLWDMAKQDSHVTIPAGGAKDATLVPGGRYLVTSTTNTDGVERKTVWNTVSGNEVSSFDANRAPLYAIGRPAEFYSADGALYGTIDLSDHVRAWDLATGQPVRSWTGRDHWVDFATMSPDRGLLATWTGNQTGEIRETGSGTPSARMTELAGAVRSASFSGDGRRLVAANDGGNVMVWEASTGRVLLALSAPPAPE